MGKHYSDTAILDALWSWSGRVAEAAASIGMNRGTYYERLDALAIKGDRLAALRETGQLRLSDGSDYVPSAGVVRYVQPKESVPVISDPPLHNFQGTVEHATTGRSVPVTQPKRSWLPKPTRSATLIFDRAILELAEVGKDTTRDGLLEALAHSEHFLAFVRDTVALYVAKARRDEEEV